MNTAAGCDALLALVALGLALVQGRRVSAVGIAGSVLAAAAVLGSLRFAAVWVVPGLHQLASALGATVALPLLAAVALWPQGTLARQPRYAWIFAVVAGAICVLVVVVAGVRLWSSAWALGSVVLMLVVAARRRQGHGVASALCFLAGFAAFLASASGAGLQPGDFLHLGMAAGLLLWGRWWRSWGLPEAQAWPAAADSTAPRP